MSMKPRRCALLALLLIGLGPEAALSQAPARSTSSQQGASQVCRFSLLAQPEGTVFLIDSATGRVWRYTQLVIDENDPAIKRAIDGLWELRKQKESTRFPNGIMPTALENELREVVKQEYEREQNPCTGTKACFLEVDRGSLTPKGWVSEIIPNP
jgi:hypothetical protein